MCWFAVQTFHKPFLVDTLNQAQNFHSTTWNKYWFPTPLQTSLKSQSKSILLFAQSFITSKERTNSLFVNPTWCSSIALEEPSNPTFPRVNKVDQTVAMSFSRRSAWTTGLDIVYCVWVCVRNTWFSRREMLCSEKSISFFTYFFKQLLRQFVVK